MRDSYRSRIVRAAAVAFGVLALLFGCGWFALSQFADGLCANEIVSEAPSPDGRFRLVAFQRDCGATTGFSTQISLLKRDQELPNSSGNVFTSDANHGLAPAGPGGGPEVRMRWSGAARVSIQHHAATRVFLNETERDGVRFDYTTFTN